MAILDLEHRLVEVNRSYSEMIGYERDELIGKSLDEITPPRYLSTLSEAEDALLKDVRRTMVYERHLLHKDGHEVPVRIITSISRHGDDGSAYLFAQVEGLEGHEDPALQVDDCQMRLDSIADILPGMVYRCLNVPSYTMLNVSGASLELTGYSPEELVGDRAIAYGDLVLEDDQATLWDGIQAAIDSHERFQSVYRIIDAEGRIRWVWEQGRMVSKTSDGIPVLEGYITDITEARETEMRFRRLVESIPFGLAEVSRDGTIHQVNSRFVEMAPMMAGAVGHDIRMILPEVVTRRRTETIDEILRTGVTRTMDIELDAVQYEVAISPLDDDLLQLIVRDVTEERDVQARESFLGSLLRHDLNNKLVTVSGFASLMGEHVDPEGADMLVSLRRAADDGLRLIEKVHRLNSIEGIVAMRTPVGPIVKSIMDDSRRMLGQGRIVLTTEGCDIDVMAGPFLEELISNLVENAVKHSGCGRIHINCRDVGDEVVVAVDDDGKGLDPAFRDAFFDRGWRSGPGAGSGLGTHLARRIALAYGGRIRVVDSELGGVRVEASFKRG